MDSLRVSAHRVGSAEKDRTNLTYGGLSDFPKEIQLASGGAEAGILAESGGVLKQFPSEMSCA